MNFNDVVNYLRSRSLYAYVFLALITTYFVITFLVAPNHETMERYHLTNFSLRLLNLTVVVPLIGIWSAAYYGFSRLRRYAKTIGKSKEAQRLTKLYLGLGVLAFGQPANSILSTILNAIARQHHNFLPSATIINNYSTMLVALIAFWLIGDGSRALTNSVRERPSRAAIQAFSLFVILIGVGYCYFIFRSDLTAAQIKVNPIKSVYFLPNWLLLISYVVPYVFIWCSGVIAAFEMRLYARTVAGVIYRKGMQYIGLGFALIIFSSVLLQYLTTLTARLLNLKIGALLLIIYPLLLAISAGYIMVALGAKKLQKIEDL